MSDKTVEKKNEDVTVPDIGAVTIVDTGDEFHVRIGGAAYTELMQTELEFPELAGNKRALAVFALTAAAAIMSKQLVEEVERSVLSEAAAATQEAPTTAQDTPKAEA